MRKLHFIPGLSLPLAAGPHSSAQQQRFPAHFASWSGQPTPMWVEKEAPSNYLDLWKETGRTPGEFCEYSSGDAKIDVGLQKYRDPSSAYEMYTALIRPEMHPSTLNRTSAVEGDRLFVLLGNSILEVRPTPVFSTADLVPLVNSVGAHADQPPLPPIRTYLPRGFSDGTQRYARGPAAFLNAIVSLKQGEFANLAGEAGFHSNAEAMLAQYRAGKDEAVLLLIEYPPPQLAGQPLRHLEHTPAPAGTQAGTARTQSSAPLASRAD